MHHWKFISVHLSALKDVCMCQSSTDVFREDEQDAKAKLDAINAVCTAGCVVTSSFGCFSLL